MTAPSNANTSGLDYFGYRVFNAGVGACWLVANPGPNDTNPEPLVTAASAQARIAELEAENEALTKALTGLTCGGSEFFTRKGDRYVADIKACVDWVRRAKNDAHRRSVVAIKRATAAEARADRLAKAGDRLVDALHRYGFPVSGGARVALTDRGSNEAVELDEAASNFRAALQQETQP